MTTWLPKTINKIPTFSSHTIGVGGFVVDENQRVLVVQELNGPAKNFWKLPGGALETGEDIKEGAIREVLEETGIETEFVSLVSFHQHQDTLFGQSVIYFVVYLRPKTTQIKKQEDEIADAMWMDVRLTLLIPQSSYINPIMDMSSPDFKITIS